jgi:hypothetical protein
MTEEKDAGEELNPELREIETAAIDELLAIRSKDEELHGLLSRAEENRDKVSAPVFERVKADYEKRIAELAAQAEPLRDDARRQLARLAPLHARFQAALAAARLDVEEIEFRHDVGEIDDDAFGAKHEAAQRSRERCEADFEQADELRNRFVDVIGADADEPPPRVPASPSEAIPVQDIAPAEAEPAGDDAVADLVDAPPGEADETEEHPPETKEDPDVTAAMDRPNLEPPEEDEGDDDGADTPKPDGTLVMEYAKLEPIGKETEPIEVGPQLTIGRAPDNDLSIRASSVSRKHAVIQLKEDSYWLEDLGSENGTVVNGKKIKKDFLKLAEGDRIRIGPREFTFRTK